MPYLQLNNIKKNFDNVTAVNQVSFDIEKGHIISIVGPSGCGKTTLLRMIAGHERPCDGTMSLDEKVIYDQKTFVNAAKRNIGMVFQEFALFPHLTVSQNVSFGMKKITKLEKDIKTQELLKLLCLSDHAGKYPHELSGGQQQRVALARALAVDPDLILFDEPFSNLDVSLRKEMRQEIKNILKEKNITAIFVLHDQEDALYLSDKIILMEDGKIVQIGEPKDLYFNPRNVFASNFLGESNFITGEVLHKDNDKLQVRCEFGDFYLRDKWNINTAKVCLGIRPEAIEIEIDGPYQGEVLAREFYGPYQVFTVRYKDSLVKINSESALNYQVGNKINFNIRQEFVNVFLQ